MRLQRRIVFLSLLLLVVLAAGTVGFHYLEGWTLFEGFYMTLITLTTIGYSEIGHLDHTGRVFNVGLIVVGFTTLFALVGTLTQALIEMELGVFGKRRMERQLGKLKDHYIVCGVGRVGRAVAKEFDAARMPYVIVESDTERARWALDRDVMLVVGDATREDILRRAGVERARGLIAAVAGDAQNIYITLTARELNPGMRIVARAAEEEAEKSLRRAGADLIISPYSYTGHRIAQALLRPNVVDFLDNLLGPLDTREMRLQIEELRVGERSPLAGQTLADVHTGQIGIIVLAVKREGRPLAFKPASQERLAAGDFLIAVGENNNLKKLEGLCGG
jgi:voltage-gated potassium channel